MTSVAFTHVGICVRDLERSLRFWQEAMGFSRTGELRIEAGNGEQAVWIYAKALEGQYPWKTVHGSQVVELLPGDYVIEDESGAKREVAIRSHATATVVFPPE